MVLAPVASVNLDGEWGHISENGEGWSLLSLAFFALPPRPLILRPTLKSHVPKPEIRTTPEHVNWTIIFKIRVRVSVCPFHFLSPGFPGFPRSLLCFSTCPRRLEIKPMELARLLIANFPKPYPLFRRNSFSSLGLLYSLHGLRLSYPWYRAKNPPKQVESCLKFRTLLYATWPRAAASITSTTLLLTYCSDIYGHSELCTVEPWILLVRLQKNLRIFCFQKTLWLDNLLPSVAVWVPAL